MEDLRYSADFSVKTCLQQAGLRETISLGEIETTILAQ